MCVSGVSDPDSLSLLFVWMRTGGGQSGPDEGSAGHAEQGKGHRSELWYVAFFPFFLTQRGMEVPLKAGMGGYGGGKAGTLCNWVC